MLSYIFNVRTYDKMVSNRNLIVLYLIVNNHLFAYADNFTGKYLKHRENRFVKFHADHGEIEVSENY